MPEPGSHAYDVQRQRLRAQYDHEGTPDKNATVAANEELQGGRATGSARMAADDRVEGPAGERSGGGDPGNVLELRTTAFSDGAPIPGRYAKDGEDVSPALQWSGVPEGTVELVLICEDPDAPNGTWLHWAMTGIDPSTTSVDEGEQPPGATAWRNDYGDEGWGGPQPPVGDEAHRYVFRLYALPEPVGVGPEKGIQALRQAVEAKRTAVGTLVGRFAR